MADKKTKSNDQSDSSTETERLMPSSDENFPTMSVNDGAMIINQLESTLQNSSTPSLHVFEQNIKNCFSILDGCPSEGYNNLVLELLNSDAFNKSLDKLILWTITPEFTKRDYFSYDRSDFNSQWNVTESVLEFVIKLLYKVDSLREVNTFQPDKGPVENTSNEEHSISIIRKKLSPFLPDLLLMVAGNASNPKWSSKKCGELSLQLIQALLQLYGLERVSDILAISISLSGSTENFSAKSKDWSMLSYLLNRFELPLSRERWEKNPFLCEAFLWIGMQLIAPQLSLCIAQVLAMVLNFLHNFDANNKLKGLQLLGHLIKTVSNEELRWYNRAEVIYEALKTQMYSKENLVLDGVIACMFAILKILEKPQGEMKRHRFVLSTLLTNAESENLLTVRRIYIFRLSQFVLSCGHACFGHLGSILRVIGCYLEIEDGPDESARFSALDVLQNVLKIAWPRVGLHSATILKFLLKFVININSPSFVKMRGEILKKKCEDKVIDSLKLLSELSPSVKTCLDALRKSNHQGYLDSVLKSLTLTHKL